MSLGTSGNNCVCLMSFLLRCRLWWRKEIVLPPTKEPSGTDPALDDNVDISPYAAGD